MAERVNLKLLKLAASIINKTCIVCCCYFIKATVLTGVLLVINPFNVQYKKIMSTAS